MAQPNGHATTEEATVTGKVASFAVKAGLAQMLKGGVIMDVVDVAQARIAEEAGAVAGACVSSRNFVAKLLFPLWEK